MTGPELANPPLPRELPPDEPTPAPPAATAATAATAAATLAPAPVAWPVQVLVVWPARVVAFAVFLPLRMLYELVALVLRWVVRATWEWLLYPALRLLFGTLRIFFKALWVVLSALWDWVLRPAGRALAWLWTRVGRPLLRLVWLGSYNFV